MVELGFQTQQEMVEAEDRVAVEVHQMDPEVQAPPDKAIMVEQIIQVDHMQVVVAVALAVLVQTVHKILEDQAA